MMFVAQESNMSHRSPNVIYTVVLTKSLKDDDSFDVHHFLF
jgi:hypothetical protein